MSVTDLSKAWDQAAQQALEVGQAKQLSSAHLSSAAGLRVRSGVAAGSEWTWTADLCTNDCSGDYCY